MKSLGNILENVDLIPKAVEEASAGMCYNQISFPKKNSPDDRVKNELKSLLYLHRPKNAGAWSRGWQWGNREGKPL